MPPTEFHPRIHVLFARKHRSASSFGAGRRSGSARCYGTERRRTSSNSVSGSTGGSMSGVATSPRTGST